MLLREVLPFQDSSVKDSDDTVIVYMDKPEIKEVSPGSTVTGGNITSFIKQNHETGRQELVITHESLLLRTIWLLVDNNKKVEAITNLW